MYELICQKPAHFLLAQMSSFFEMFVVHGMYNFAIQQSRFVKYEHLDA